MPMEYEKAKTSSRLGLRRVLGRKTDRERKLYVRIEFEPVIPPTRSAEPNPIYNLVYVNDEEHPILINNEYFTGHAVIRVRDFNGWTPLDEKIEQPLPVISTCEYFKGHKRSFSLQVSGRFRKQWTGDDILFGTFFDKPLTLPRGYTLALNLAKHIDPSMVAKLDGQQPYMCSPLICAVNTFHIQPLLMSNATLNYDIRRTASVNVPAHVSQFRRSIVEAACESRDDLKDLSKPLTLPDWQWIGASAHMEENAMSSWPSWIVMPKAINSRSQAFYENDNSSLLHIVSRNRNSTNTRRHWFLDEQHRKRFMFHPDTVYSFDFANNYCDLNKMKLSLGISIDVENFIGDQPVKYQCRTRDGRVVFFTVELALK